MLGKILGGLVYAQNKFVRKLPCNDVFKIIGHIDIRKTIVC